MYSVLAAGAAVIGLVVTGIILFTLWDILFRHKNDGSAADKASAYFQRWTVLDYAMIALFAVGALFLLADIIGVVRERNLLAYHHYGYLLSGIVYCCLGMLFMLGRLVFLLRGISRMAASPPQKHKKPKKANAAK